MLALMIEEQRNNSCNLRSSIACLIETVYTLSTDPHGSQVAPVDNFELIDKLRDEKDSSIYGALYKYNGQSLLNIPQFVIAFRGTKLRRNTWVEDIKLDAKCMANRPQNSSRFKHAMEYVRNMVTSSRSASVWLAGHSLGAAIALLAGKQMFKEGHFLITYLFNPPFCSDFIARWLKNDTLGFCVRLAKSAVKAGLSHFGEDRAAEAHKAFEALSNWVPYLFVNRDDPVSSEYIYYFENRQTMLELGFGKFAIKASSRTMRMTLGIDSSSEAIHFIPSAILTIYGVESHRDTRCFFKEKISAHNLQQWLSPDSPCQTRDYRYSTTN
nr:gdsl esterase/lipase [Quercus suber]